MAETGPIINDAPGHEVASARYGRPEGPPGVVATVVQNRGLAVVTAGRGKAAALTRAIAGSFGVELPATPRYVDGGSVAFVGLGPGRWLAVARPAPCAGMEAFLAPATKGLAAVVDQSHGLVVLRLAGPHVRDALAKFVPIDLHPRVLGPGSAASTLAGQLTVHVWLSDDAGTFELAMARSSAGTFWQTLAAAAASFGLLVENPASP
ncbi:MAG: sarcosine oxidase subunit gamma family protein [Hyphomicrobiaceae bacterium]|nr:sarcosine oxidase subunit gamma family protein [Hyphomicrobiaceae bacterium]